TSNVPGDEGVHPVVDANVAVGSRPETNRVARTSLPWGIRSLFKSTNSVKLKLPAGTAPTFRTVPVTAAGIPARRGGAGLIEMSAEVTAKSGRPGWAARSEKSS